MKEEIRASAAICATLVGAGFASGREIVTFFSQFGAAGWLGVPVAGAGIALITYLVMSLAQRTGARSFPQIYGRLMNVACEQSIHLLHGLMCLMTAAAMLAASGELFALTLPIVDARLTGVLLTLAICLYLTGRGVKALSLVGYLLVPGLLCFYLLLGWRAKEPATLTLNDALLSLPMGVLYASFNGALCGGAMALVGQRKVKASRCALLTGGLMTLMLAAAHWALSRAGEETCALALPSAALSARWGMGGFYACAAFLYLAVLTTLVGMLLSLRAQLLQLLPGRPAMCLLIPAGGALLMSVCGFQTIVGLIYPLLGWVCVLALVVLPFFWKETPCEPHGHAGQKETLL